ncbi:hypothetical protein [Paenarthrobacter histidinolovorans]|uniref:hypothetical protein n=1 Tax=Paenarthrobacter histidinolovorans TaxID=43664 RepID=UPI00384D3187
MVRSARRESIGSKAEAAMNALGINAFRALVLRALFQNPEGMLSGQVAEMVGGGVMTTWRHLVELEKQGLVEALADENEPNRQGQRVVYRLNRQACDEAIKAWVDFLGGR